MPTIDQQTGGYWNAEAQSIHFDLAGEVFDGQSGQPIESFEAELAGQKIRSFETFAKKTLQFDNTNDGHFRVSGLGLGTWRLTVRAEGYAPSTQTIKLNEPTDDPYIVVPMSQGGKLSGIVTDWRGQPVDKAEISIAQCKEKLEAQSCPRTKTDIQGAFLLDGTPEDHTFSIVAQHPQYGVATRPNLKLNAGDTEHISIQLSGVLKVSGYVFSKENTSPIANAKVVATDIEVYTDDSGYYELLMPLQRYPKVRALNGSSANPTQFASYPNNRSVEPIQWVDAEDHVATLTKNFFIAAESATLHGKVTMEDGSPAVNIDLRIRNTMGWFPGKRPHQTFPEVTRTDADGRYRIENLPAYAGYRLQALIAEETHDLGTVVIEEPQEMEASFSLQGLVLRGRFVDRSERQPFPLNAQNCARFGAHRMNDDAIYQAHCLDNGSFEFKHLPAGKYRLGGLAPNIHAEVSFEEVMVDLRQDLSSGHSVQVLTEGSRQIKWSARVVNQTGKFIDGLMLRYRYSVGGTRTLGLPLAENGTVSFEIPEQYSKVYIDCPGYKSTKINLKDHDPKQIIDITMQREATSKPQQTDSD